MEERPSTRAHEKRYHHHGEERSPRGPRKAVKNGQSRCEHPHQEAQAKKTGNGKLNGNTVEGEKIIFANDSVGIPYVTYTNGTRQYLDGNFKARQQGKEATAQLKVGTRVGPRKNSMDSKNDKPSDCAPRELVDKELVLPLNGIVNLSPSYVANGYLGKLAQDSDGCSSEGGHTSPKKWRAQCSSVKGVEAGQPGSTMPAARDSQPSSPEPAERSAVGARPDSARAEGASLMAAELQRRNSDIKSAVTAGKKVEDRTGRVKLPASAIMKEDSWTLFRPPPVFPVDNSSAKIVPKISYASKVKENLNKTTQVGAETLAPGKVSQVPISAMKTIASPSFTNGPIPGDGSTLGPAQALLPGAPAAEGPASCLQASENVASPPHTNAVGPVAPGEQQHKPGICVHALSSTQPTLPSARPVDVAVLAAGRKALGDIFQNQWGLSFINEPSAGPQAGRSAADVGFQDELPAALAPGAPETSQPNAERMAPTKASRSDRRTSSLSPSGVPRMCLDAVPTGDAVARTQPSVADGHAQGVVSPASPQDPGADRPAASPTSRGAAVDRELDHLKGSEWKCSWGLFDLKAAVLYHTKEIEDILNLQKQDPKRVVVYDESVDGPGQ